MRRCLWVPILGLLLLLGGLWGASRPSAPLSLRSLPDRVDQTLFRWTGEEAWLPQLRGLFQLAANVTRPQPHTADFAPVAHAGVNPFGINTFLEQEVEPWKRERVVQMIAQAGFHWIRQEFPWEDIEIHGKGDFEDRRHEPYRSAWEKYDQIVDLAERYGLEIIARLSNPPAWSRAQGDALGPYAPPDDIADYGDFVYAVVSRYRGRIRYYQLWNEPNIYPEWGNQPVDPVGYTRLLCEGYRRAKEADPQVVILSGALAPTAEMGAMNPWGGNNLNDLLFLEQMYRAGAGDCFDILAVNDYILWSGPTDHRMRPVVLNFSRPRYLREIMVRYGDAHKPIWISEMNSNALPPDHPAYPAYGRVTLEQQARYAPLAYQRIQEEWPWVGVVNFWFFKRPSDAERDQAWYYFRMVEPDFTPMPVYEAMKSYATRPPLVYPGYHQEDHWAIAWSDGWREATDPQAVLGGYRVTEAVGETARFTFRGTGLDLVVGTGPQGGSLAVTVEPAEPDGRVWQRAIALVSAEPRFGVLVPVVSRLPPGRYRVRITANPQSPGQAIVDGLIVRRAPGRTLLPLAVLLLGLGWMARIGLTRWYQEGATDDDEAEHPPRAGA